MTAIITRPIADGSGTPPLLGDTELEPRVPASSSGDCDELAGVAASAAVSHWVLAAAVLVPGSSLLVSDPPVALERESSEWQDYRPFRQSRARLE